MNDDAPPPVDRESENNLTRNPDTSTQVPGSAIDQIDQINRVAFRRILDRPQPAKGARQTRN